MAKSKVLDLDALLNIEIHSQKTHLLTAPGEHYGSVMLALEVISKNEKRYDLVAKLIPANDMLRLAFDIYVTFKKEVLAYTVTVPCLTQLQIKYNIPVKQHYDRLFPKCYGARNSLKNPEIVDDTGVIIFENLKKEGYFTEDRLVGFDLESAKVIIQDLALFHAVPIALKILDPEQFQKKVMISLVRNKGLEQLPPDVGLAFHNSIMEGAREIEKLAPYLSKLQKIVDYTAEHPYVQRPGPKEPWGSISHSDFWVSNTMILKDKTGKTIRNKIVDLQIMTYSSIARDLLFFLFTSIRNNVLDQYFDEFLELYHKNFVATLEGFGLDTEQFSWDKFQKELEEVIPTEVYHILVMLKPICTERGTVQNSLEDFQDSDWSRKDLLGPSHQRKLKETVLALAKRRWI